MAKLFSLITSATLLAAASAYAQSATPIEGNPSPARPAQTAPSATTGAGSATTTMPGGTSREAPLVAPGTANPYGAIGGSTGEQNPDRVAPRNN